MSPEDLNHHLISAAGEASRRTRELLGTCWPGGPEDRSERAALAWVRRWRPEKLGAAVPACSCPSGRCVVCN